MDKFEMEFWERFRSLEFDSRACCTFVYTELVVHQLASNDRDLSDRLTLHSMFWNGVLGGLQTASFTALGRLYYMRGDTHNIRELLKFVRTYRGIFSKAALAKRKIENGLPIEDAAKFAREAEGLAEGDLAKIEEAAGTYQDYYNEKVRPIRHQVFAHAGALTANERDEIFSQLDLRQYQDLVLFPLRLHRALRELFHKGRGLTLEKVPTEINEVLANLPGHGPATWEHLHVTARVTAMMDALMHMPNPIRKAATCADNEGVKIPR